MVEHQAVDDIKLQDEGEKPPRSQNQISLDEKIGGEGQHGEKVGAANIPFPSAPINVSPIYGDGGNHQIPKFRHVRQNEAHIGYGVLPEGEVGVWCLFVFAHKSVATEKEK